MSIDDSIKIMNEVLADKMPWLDTRKFASLVSIDGELGYAVEKEYKDRDNVMPSDVNGPISYFVMRNGMGLKINGANALGFQRGQMMTFKIKQIFIINVDEVEDADELLFTDKISMCRSKILDCYINKQINTNFSINTYSEDLENVFDGVKVDKYTSMRYPYYYIGLDLSVVVTVDCL